MRLMQRDLKPVYVFEKQESESEYVGTEITDVYCCKIMCCIQPLENSTSAEIYGERIKNMRTLIMDVKTDITLQHTVSMTGTDKPTHKVIALQEYTTHKTATIEVIS